MGIRKDNFYKNLNTKKVGDSPADSINVVSRDVNLEKDNIEVLDSIIKVNKATLRDGGYIPMTGAIKTVSVNEADNNKVIFQPQDGEVWSLLAASHTYSSSGQNGANLMLTDGTNDVIVADSSSGGDFNDHGFKNPIFFDSKLYPKYKAVNITGVDLSTCSIAIIRVR